MYENLNVYRGSTFNCCIKLQDIFGKDFIISDKDEIIFGVKESIKADTETKDIITKILTCNDEIMGEYPFKLTPQETKLFPKKYYYYFAVKFADGDYYQVVPYSIFEVKIPIGLSYNPDDNKIFGMVPRKSIKNNRICNMEGKKQ